MCRALKLLRLCVDECAVLHSRSRAPYLVLMELCEAPDSANEDPSLCSGDAAAGDATDISGGGGSGETSSEGPGHEERQKQTHPVGVSNEFPELLDEESLTVREAHQFRHLSR